jgi:hypothetical protein
VGVARGEMGQANQIGALMTAWRRHSGCERADPSCGDRK